VRSFTCDEARAGFSDYLAGECGRPEANLLEVHLGGCSPCLLFAEKLVWQDRVIVELAGRAKLDSMAARIGSSLESLDQVAVGEAGPASPRRWLAFAAAAVFLFAAGAAAVFFWPSHPADVVREPVKPGVTDQVRAPETPPVPESRGPAPDPGPDPTPQVPDPKIPPESPKPPAAPDVKVAAAPEKKIDPNLVPKEVPKPPVEARDSGKLPPTEKPPAIQLAPAKTVDEAINRGVGFLRLRSPKLDFSQGAGREARPEELVLWTYFMAGVPESDPEFQRLFKGILERKLEKTYDVSLQAMLLEELDRVKYQGRLHQCAQFLADNQCKNGQWSYGAPSLFVDEIASGSPVAVTSGGAKPGPREFSSPYAKEAKDKPVVKKRIPVSKRREGPESGDNSNSMYAALGLRACHDAGIQFPEAMALAAEKAWREAIHLTADEGGWCYGPKGHAHKAYGSMTAGGVGSLVIYDYILHKDWRKDREVDLGLKWLARNFSVAYNPGPYEHGNYAENTRAQLFYFLYALERAGILFGTEKIGSHEWYKEGSRELLDTQRLDGAWESGGDVNDTCFAILFLRRATRVLPPVASK
jgi:hypothetical protein